MHTINNPPPSYADAMGLSASANNNSASSQPTSNSQEYSQMSDSYPSSTLAYPQQNNFSDTAPYPVQPPHVSIESIQQSQSASVPCAPNTIIMEPAGNSKTFRSYVFLKSLVLVLAIVSVIILLIRIIFWIVL